MTSASAFWRCLAFGVVLFAWIAPAFNLLGINKRERPFENVEAMEEGSTSNADNANAMQRLMAVYNQVTEVGVDVAQVLLEPVSMHFFSRNHRNGDLSKTFLLLFAHHGFQTLVAPQQNSPRPAIAVYAASIRRGNVDDQFAKRDTALVERAAPPAPPATVPAPSPLPSPLSASLNETEVGNVGVLATEESLGTFGVPSVGVDSTTGAANAPSALDVFKDSSVLVEEPNAESSNSTTGKSKMKQKGNHKGKKKHKNKMKNKGNHHTPSSDKSNVKTKSSMAGGGSEKGKNVQVAKQTKIDESSSSDDNDNQPSSPR